MRSIRFFSISDRWSGLMFILFMMLWAPAWAQPGPASEDRFRQMEQHMKDLASSNPGLKEVVDFSVSGATIQEFLRGLADANNLNVSIDPSLNFRIYNNFTNEKVMNILLFLAREYDLDIRFIGSIMSFHPHREPLAPAPEVKAKEILIRYNSYSDLLTMDLQSDTLSKIVKKITQESKKNVVLSSGLNDKIINVYIQDAPFDNALDKMAYANNLKVEKTEDNFYVVRGLQEGEELNMVKQVKQTSSYNSPFPTIDKTKTKKETGPQQGNNELFVDVKGDSIKGALITVEAINAPIAETIKQVAGALGVNYFLFSEIKGNSTVRVANVQFDDFLKRLLQGTEYTFKISSDLYLIGERKLEGLRAHKVIQLQFRSVKDVMEVIPAEIKKGVEIKEFVELNSLLLTGAFPQIEEIEAFVKVIDKVVPMVLIDVIIMDIRKGRKIETGISAGMKDTTTSGSLLPEFNMVLSSRTINDFLNWLGVNNAVNLGRVTPKFYVGLKALEQNNNVEVRSTPKLSTLNGHKATLSIGSTRYYSNETQNVVGSLNPQTVITRQFHQVQANLAITINPMVAGDDQVTLEIDVNNSDFLEAPENRPPASATSQFNSMIRVRNEDMIVLGGLERYEKTDNRGGFPILQRIPVLNWIFGTRSKGRSKTVTIVFIKPTIIY